MKLLLNILVTLFAVGAVGGMVATIVGLRGPQGEFELLKETIQLRKGVVLNETFFNQTTCRSYELDFAYVSNPGQAVNLELIRSVDADWILKRNGNIIDQGNWIEKKYYEALVDGYKGFFMTKFHAEPGQEFELSIVVNEMYEQLNGEDCLILANGHPACNEKYLVFLVLGLFTTFACGVFGVGIIIFRKRKLR